ncbi:Histone deacetylase complex subunit CTI6 [Smittium culicis]|uniref:Histone deacetylase complex subunit CTI6 n=1 Tax=Smittium culicis TaxID=133412 RepID=A0A1R1XS71_9FUNG|nr:Histone deacetylase complex subunit CTI6 [Smittium culicis]OMJ18062.1 Histone deacetylase complex subunit CTI6 [Smittium culicis]
MDNDPDDKDLTIFSKRISKRKAERNNNRNRYSPSPDSDSNITLSVDLPTDNKNSKHSKQTKKKSPVLLDADLELSQNENEDGVVRCMCGLMNDGELMIQCEECHDWQHTLCVGIRDEKNIPDKYYCEKCKEDDHPYINQQPRTIVLAREAELWGTNVATGVRKAATAALSAISNINHNTNRFKHKNFSDSPFTRVKSGNSPNVSDSPTNDVTPKLPKSKSLKKKNSDLSNSSTKNSHKSINLSNDKLSSSESNSESSYAKPKRSRLSSDSSRKSVARANSYSRKSLNKSRISSNNPLKPPLFDVSSSKSADFNLSYPKTSLDTHLIDSDFNDSEKSEASLVSPSLFKKSSKRNHSFRFSKYYEADKAPRKSSTASFNNYNSDESTITNRDIESNPDTKSALYLQSNHIKKPKSSNRSRGSKSTSNNLTNTPNTELDSDFSIENTSSSITLKPPNKQNRNNHSKHKNTPPSNIKDGSSSNEKSDIYLNDTGHKHLSKESSINDLSSSKNCNNNESLILTDNTHISPSNIDIKINSSSIPPVVDSFHPPETPNSTYNSNLINSSNNNPNKPSIGAALSEYIQWRNLQKITFNSSQTVPFSPMLSSLHPNAQNNSNQNANSIKVKFPSTRSSLHDMNKRTSIILEYINRKKSELLSEIEFFNNYSSIIESVDNSTSENFTVDFSDPESELLIKRSDRFVNKTQESVNNLVFCEHGSLCLSNISSINVKYQLDSGSEIYKARSSSTNKSPNDKDISINTNLNSENLSVKQKTLNIKFKSCNNSVHSSPLKLSNLKVIDPDKFSENLSISYKTHNSNFNHNSNKTLNNYNTISTVSAPLSPCSNTPSKSSSIFSSNSKITHSRSSITFKRTSLGDITAESHSKLNISNKSNIFNSVSLTPEKLNLDPVIGSIAKHAENSDTSSKICNENSIPLTKNSSPVINNENTSNIPEKDAREIFESTITIKDQASSSPNLNKALNDLSSTSLHTSANHLLSKISITGNFYNLRPNPKPKTFFSSAPHTPSLNQFVNETSGEVSKTEFIKRQSSSLFNYVTSENANIDSDAAPKFNISDYLKVSKPEKTFLDESNNQKNSKVEIVHDYKENCNANLSNEINYNTSNTLVNRSHRKLDLDNENENEFENLDLTIDLKREIDQNLTKDQKVIKKCIEIKLMDENNKNLIEDLKDSNQIQVDCKIDSLKPMKTSELPIEEPKNEYYKDQTKMNNMSNDCVHCHKNYINRLIEEIDRLSYLIDEFQSVYNC